MTPEAAVSILDAPMLFAETTESQPSPPPRDASWLASSFDCNGPAVDAESCPESSGTSRRLPGPGLAGGRLPGGRVRREAAVFENAQQLKDRLL